MRHADEDQDPPLHTTIGTAAQLTEEENRRRPTLRPWRARETAALSPSGQRDMALTSMVFGSMSPQISTPATKPYCGLIAPPRPTRWS
jgi:hypothetical protein